MGKSTFITLFEGPSAVMTQFVVVGAGLSGSFMALRLAQLQYLNPRILLLEKRKREQLTLSSPESSINLALSARALSGLESFPLLRTRIIYSSIPMYGRMCHFEGGKEAIFPYSPYKTDYLLSIGRNVLLELLLEECERKGLEIEFQCNSKVIGCNLDERWVQVQSVGGGEGKFYAFDFLVGADGFNSVVRELARVEYLEVDSGLFYQEIEGGGEGKRIGEESEKERNASSNALRNVSSNESSNALSTALRNVSSTALRNVSSNALRNALSNESSSAHSTALSNAPQTLHIQIPTDQRHFLHVWPMGFEMAVALPNAHKAASTYTLFSLHRGKRHLRTILALQLNVGKRCALIGDAAHALLPFYGQGVNAGFEDAVILTTILQETGSFFAFTVRRFPDSRRIFLLSIENFYSMNQAMQSSVAWIEHWISNFVFLCLPALYAPLYYMISFTTIPYEQAFQLHRRRKRVFWMVIWFVLVVVLVKRAYSMFCE